jgi:hypothetical protein
LAFNGPVLIPIFARDVLHGGAAGHGDMMAAQGIGALLTAFPVAFLQSHRPGKATMAP